MTWLVAGLAMAALELAAPGFFLLWLGLAAIGTGALTEMAALSWHGQLAAFAALAVLLVAWSAWRRRPVPDTVNAAAAGLIGSLCTAEAFTAGEGRVRFRDGAWRARLLAGPDPLADQTLRIVGLDGTTLLVEPLAPARAAPSAASSS